MSKRFLSDNDQPKPNKKQKITECTIQLTGMSIYSDSRGAKYKPTTSTIETHIAEVFGNEYSIDYVRNHIQYDTTTKTLKPISGALITFNVRALDTEKHMPFCDSLIELIDNRIDHFTYLITKEITIHKKPRNITAQWQITL